LLSNRDRLGLINLMEGDDICVCFFVEILKMPQSDHEVLQDRARLVKACDAPRSL